MMYLQLSIISQSGTGVLLTIYTLASCRLTNNHREFFEGKTRNFLCCKLRLIDVLDLMVFIIALVLNLAVTGVIFGLMISL